MMQHSDIAAFLDQRRSDMVSKVIYYSGYLALAMVASMFIAWLLMRHTVQLLGYALAIAPIAVTAFLYPYLKRAGQARLGAYLFIGSVFLNLYVSLVLIPEVILTGGIMAAAIIILGFIVFGEREGRWVSLAVVAGMFVDVLINRFAPLRWPTTVDPTIIFFINLLVAPALLVIVWVLMRLIISEQDAAVGKLQEANQRLDAVAGESTQGRVRLEAVIQRYEGYMSEISKGNLTARLDLNESDAWFEPIFALGSSLSAMTENLHRMIQKIKEASQNITSASTEILAANTEQVAGATQTSASVAQTTTTVEELKALADHVLDSTLQMAESAQRTVEVSRAGRQSVTSTIQSMMEIRGRVEGIAESILALSEKTQQIGEIIAMVGDLASQSNMLALNASIEASRAGEAGKGFGVVAQEMRTLAEQSRRATAQIKEILSEIQSATNSTVMATEEGSKVVDRGVMQAENAQQSIDQLSAAIDENNQISQQINAGGRQQLAGVEQVALTMQHINQATMQNVSSSRQTEGAARNLTQLAQSLVEEVARYQV